MTNEAIFERAAELAALATRADRTNPHDPQDLTITSEMISTPQGFQIRWLAHLGNFTTYPNRYETISLALDGLQSKILNALPRGGDD